MEIWEILNCFNLLTDKRFWKAIKVFIQELFKGMDNQEDWEDIWKNARDRAIGMYVMPLMIEAATKMLIDSSNELDKSIMEMQESMVNMFKACGELEWEN